MILKLYKLQLKNFRFSKNIIKNKFTKNKTYLANAFKIWNIGLLKKEKSL